MKETPRRRITVTSSLNEISTGHGLGYGREALLRPHPFLKQATGQIFEDDENGSPLHRKFASCNIGKPLLASHIEERVR
jgi:hypothetical protein